MDEISKHISYKEATKSSTAIRYGINNKPDATQLANMKIVADNCFEPLRKHHGKRIGISSFFRSVATNKKIGGSATSDHCKGRAIDIDADIYDNGITNAQIFFWLYENVEFDQLIWEYGTKKEPNWVHVSYRSGKNRKQTLIVKRVNGKSVYTVFDPND